MFRSATLRLTVAYLGIIMLISLFFSTLIYNVSSRELNNTFRGPNGIVGDLPEFVVRSSPGLQAALDKQLAASHSKLLRNLYFTNLIVLAVAGAASYALARYTLRPIEEIHEAQSRFTADASHELRTPLTAMQTEIEVALRDTRLSKDQARSLLKSNLEELQKLTALSEGLLRLARLDSSALVLERVELGQVAQDAVSRLLPLAERKEILLEQEIDDTVAVAGDPSALLELAVILIDNAIKYSPSKSMVRVRVAQQGRQAVLDVLDHGVGIKASHLPHIFERFYRADHARAKDQPGGYGLGLSIAKSIADMHGAHIEVSSIPGKRTVFAVRFPAI